MFNVPLSRETDGAQAQLPTCLDHRTPNGTVQEQGGQSGDGMRVPNLLCAVTQTHQCTTFCEECYERTYARVCEVFAAPVPESNGDGSVHAEHGSSAPNGVEQPGDRAW